MLESVFTTDIGICFDSTQKAIAALDELQQIFTKTRLNRQSNLHFTFHLLYEREHNKENNNLIIIIAITIIIIVVVVVVVVVLIIIIIIFVIIIIIIAVVILNII